MPQDASVGPGVATPPAGAPPALWRALVAERDASLARAERAEALVRDAIVLAGKSGCPFCGQRRHKGSPLTCPAAYLAGTR